MRTPSAFARRRTQYLWAHYLPLAGVSSAAASDRLSGTRRVRGSCSPLTPSSVIMFRRSQVPSPTPPAVGSSPSSSFELDPPRSPPDDANEQSKFVPSHRRGRGSGSLDLEAYGGTGR